MKELYYTDRSGISLEKVTSMCEELLSQYPGAKKVLIVPPDYTRCYSFAGEITKILYPRLKAMGAEVKVMPALGTHMALSAEEKEKFFGDVVPDEDMLVHHWQSDTTVLGKVPAATAVTALGTNEDGSWVVVNYNGIYGWLKTEYLNS